METIPVIWCDNIGATSLAVNQIFHARTKHIEIDVHFIRDHIAAGKLKVDHIVSTEQVADIFTKPLAFKQFTYLRNKLNVANRTLSLNRGIGDINKSGRPEDTRS